MPNKPQKPVKDKRMALCGECYASAGGTMTGRFRPVREGERCENSDAVACDHNPANEGD